MHHVHTPPSCSIGFSIARRLCRDGAAVMVSSRKQANVDRAVERLRGDGVRVEGMVCHVGKADHRKKLVEEVIFFHYMHLLFAVYKNCMADYFNFRLLEKLAIVFLPEKLCRFLSSLRVILHSSHFVLLNLQTVSRFGGLDILVSNAAVNPVFGPTMAVSYHV